MRDGKSPMPPTQSLTWFVPALLMAVSVVPQGVAAQASPLPLAGERLVDLIRSGIPEERIIAMIEGGCVEGGGSPGFQRAFVETGASTELLQKAKEFACAEAERSTSEDISDGPTGNSSLAGPKVLNRTEVGAALEREYPASLRDAGIGGTILLHFTISETGEVTSWLLAESSGHTGLDEAAMRVAEAFRFAPAMDGDQAVSVQIQVPLVFAIRPR